MSRRWLILFFVFIGVCSILLCLLYSNQTIYALCSRDLELVFVVIDTDSREPIPNASLEIAVDQETRQPPKIVTLKTDESGTARFVREKNRCEDIVRPFRKTVTLVDLTWAVLKIEAEGHEPVEEMWLHKTRKEKNDFIRDRRLQRVEFRLPLRQRDG